jgi:hypothetical protein
MKAKFSDPERETEIFALVDKEKIKNANPADLESFFREEAQKLMVRDQPIAIEIGQLEYSHVDPKDVAGFNFGDTLVEANLPYCLHLPNYWDLNIYLPSRNLKANIIPRKFWTEKAKESDETDFFAADQISYFKNSHFVTPRYPVDLSLGWKQQFTGKNIEEIKDTDGTFRYSRIYIQFDSKTTLANLQNGRHKEKLKEIEVTTLEVVNRLLDAYRFVTKADHVVRLGTLNITTIFFNNINQGYYLMKLGHGLQSGVMNRSRKEIEEVEEILANGDNIPTEELLFLSARGSLNRNSAVLCIVESFQGLEIFLENYLIEGFKKKGIDKAAYEKTLDDKWRTKERLKEVLKEVTGHTLSENNPLWTKWINLYDNVRNEVIHQGKEASIDEARDVLDTNIEVVEWIKKL